MKDRVKQIARKTWGFVKENKLFFIYCLGLYVILPAIVYAWTTPTSGSFGYDVYDIAISKIAKGPIGFVAGAACLAGSIFAATRSAWISSGCLAIGSGLIYKLDSIAQSLGYRI